MAGLIKYQDVYRDAIQSLFGTNPSADEIIAAYQHAHLTGVDSIQVAGGTFFDLFAKKGRDEWQELEKICGFFKDKGVKLSALIRGDFLFTYEPQSYDVVRATVFEHAKLGINILQNFHGMNDARCLVGVARAVKEAKAEGYDIGWQGTLCIEDNPYMEDPEYRKNKIAELVAYAKELDEMGCEGFYLKSASGRLDPDFVYELTAALYDEIPDQPITIHAHSTYGEAPICYMAAAKAATERGKEITMDVQHPALAGSTAQPSVLKMQGLIENHPDEDIRANAPELNIDAMKADMKSLYEMRFDYRDFESTYNPRLLEAMRKARTPGGASATLKSVPGLVENLGRLLGTDDWDEIQIAIYEKQAEILDDLGQPTQVTPYAANTTGQAALSLWHELEGRDKYHTLYPGIVNFLVGKHGRVPDTVKPELVDKAVAQYNEEAERKGEPKIDGPIEYKLSTERPDELPAAKEKLKEAGIEEPTDRQAVSAVLLGNGVDHVVKCYKGENVPQAGPVLPRYAQTPANDNDRYMKNGVPVRDVRDAVQAIGGRAKLQEIAERALHLKQIDDGLYEFPQGEENLESRWYDGNVSHLAELLDGIPGRLKDAGFVDTQVLSMTMEMAYDNIWACLKDACDNKGTGLYDYMMKAVDGYRKHVDAQIKLGKVIELGSHEDVPAYYQPHATGAAVGGGAPVYARY